MDRLGGARPGGPPCPPPRGGRAAAPSPRSRPCRRWWRGRAGPAADRQQFRQQLGSETLPHGARRCEGGKLDRPAARELDPPPGAQGSGLAPSAGGIASGAAEGTRTLDIQLGKLTLYQLSYGRSRGERVRAGASGPDSPGGPDPRTSERSGNVSLDPGDATSVRLRERLEGLDAEAASRILQIALGDAELRERLVAMTEALDEGAEIG